MQVMYFFALTIAILLATYVASSAYDFSKGANIHVQEKVRTTAMSDSVLYINNVTEETLNISSVMFQEEDYYIIILLRMLTP